MFSFLDKGQSLISSQLTEISKLFFQINVILQKLDTVFMSEVQGQISRFEMDL